MALNRRRITWREHFYSKSSVKRHKNLACGDAHKDIFYPYMGEAHSRNRLRLMAASVSRISPGGKKMNKYEMIYILESALSDEAKDQIIEKIDATITKNGGVVEKTDKWGIKKLAYPIDYKTDGYYVYVAFEGDSNLVSEVKRVVGITEHVLRRLITKR